MDNNTNMTSALRLIHNGKTLFEQGDTYIIPLYQRAYAWEDGQIEALIDDISAFDDKKDSYYLGSLIVHKNSDGTYEVVDGQQRLTTLFLLFHCLELSEETAVSLKFACRDASQTTLENIDKIIKEKGKCSDEEFEPHMLNGVRVILKKFEQLSKEAFKLQLQEVLLYRIELPPHADLNRYFEIMNTRGEQLEASDVVKVRLMSSLKHDPAKRHNFSVIWDACRDMDGYVQMNFADVPTRTAVFGKDWTSFPETDRLSFNSDKGTASESTAEQGEPILGILTASNQAQTNTSERDEKTNTILRYESIIDFPAFLLHVLRICAEENHDDDVSLDDNKLLDAFDSINRKEEEDRAAFAWKFVTSLLQCRYLFDKYVIKRRFTSDDANGKWSLDKLESSSDDNGKNRKAYFVQTDFADNSTHDDILMLQSCMRVTYTSPKTMHWITEALTWLKKNKSDLSGFEEELEGILKKAVKEDYLDKGNYNLGVRTPHVVFNYLDYLLWKEFLRENDKTKEPPFVFEFRNSVEHWYPQTPSGQSFPTWDKEDSNGSIDQFGNLCIVQPNVNSKFSNLDPYSKKTTYKELVAKGSMKLRLMANVTTDSAIWRNSDCAKHGSEMIKRLEDACNS